MTNFVLFFLGATLLGYALTPLAVRLAGYLGALDKPDARKVHSRPIPRLGGLAIFGAVMLSLGVGVGLAPAVWNDSPWPSVLIGALVVYLLGLTDDVGGLGPVSKLLVQFMAAFMPAAAGLLVEHVMLPGLGHVDLGVLAVPVTMIWIVGVTNAFNLIDGLDGLAGGLGLIAAIAFFVIGVPRDPLVGLFAAALAGALTGFLRHNFNPARIFMGDSGSLFVGYLLACLAVRTTGGENPVGIAVPLLVVAVPLLDTTTAMARRYLGAILKGGPRAVLRPTVMFHPDRGHIHHRLLDCGLSQRQAVSVLYMLATALAGLAFWAREEPSAVAWTAAGAGAAAFLGVRFLTSRFVNS